MPVLPFLLYTHMHLPDPIERRGSRYYYDPERDCYCRHKEESIVSRWSWLVMVVILAAISYWAEYLR